MSQAGVLAVRALAGGTLVVVCAVAGELLRPKGFAGILAAAPSVALASLSVTLLAGGSRRFGGAPWAWWPARWR